MIDYNSTIHYKILGYSNNENDLLEENHLISLESVLQLWVLCLVDKTAFSGLRRNLILPSPLSHPGGSMSTYCSRALLHRPWTSELLHRASAFTHTTMEDFQPVLGRVIKHLGKEKTQKGEDVRKRLNPGNSHDLHPRRTKGKTSRFYCIKSPRSCFWRSQERLVHKSVPESFGGRRLISAQQMRANGVQ